MKKKRSLTLRLYETVVISLTTETSHQKKEFYSLLTDEDINDEDYKLAQNVWDYFQVGIHGDNTTTCTLSQMFLLLADVFEKFRKDLSSILRIRTPCHYFYFSRFIMGCNA